MIPGLKNEQIVKGLPEREFYGLSNGTFGFQIPILVVDIFAFFLMPKFLFLFLSAKTLTYCVRRLKGGSTEQLVYTNFVGATCLLGNPEYVKTQKSI